MWNDTIDQGATFYREVTLYTDKAKTTPLSLAGRTPRAALLYSGSKVVDMPCAIKDSGNGVIVWSLSRATTATLKTDRVYDYFIYLDDTGDDSTYPAERGKLTVNAGMPPT